MKLKLFFLFIYLVVIKAEENLEFKELKSYWNEFNDRELSENFFDYTYDPNDKPVLNIEELMKQPQLPGIDEEYLPFDDNKGCKPCKCGQKSLTRIVNGTFAKPGEFPWQVLITLFKRFNCGGSIINDLYVLTAAHCMFGYKKNTLRTRFGAYKRHATPAIYRKIARIWIHKNYNPDTLLNDISIIKLKSKIKFKPNIKPICLPIRGSTYAGKLATVTGWGRLYFQGPLSEVLRKAQLPVLSNQQCRETKYGDTIISSQICAGDNNRDSCNGDSGGPLVTFQKGRYREIGIVSYGFDCNTPGYPGVYTRVTSFLSDIIKIASKGGACWCK